MSTASATTAVVGVGSTRFGRFQDLSPYDLGAQALRLALDDAGLRLSDVDGLITHRIPDYQRFGESLGWNPRLVLGLPGQGRMSGPALSLAVAAIKSGAARTVALVYGNNGKSAGDRYGGDSDRYGSGGAGFWFPYGMTSPGAVHAIMFRRHMHLYGTTNEQLAAIAIAFRKHAALNDLAVNRNPITIEDYRQARWIVEPLRVLDYCMINDGGVAMIVTASDHALDLQQPPVFIRAASQASSLAGSTFPPDDFWYLPLRTVADDVLGRSGIDRTDISGLMIYDNFSPTVLFTLEGLGFCPVGQSGSWIQNGRIELGGALPINTSGGHLSESYMQGWGLLAEAVRQIRRKAYGRQIEGANHILYACASPIVSAIVFARDQS